jgi:hypothetical protein
MLFLLFICLLSVYFCSPYVTKSLHPNPQIVLLSHQMQHTATQESAPLDVYAEKRDLAGPEYT